MKPKHESSGDTIAVLLSAPLTTEQFAAVQDMLWALYPNGWPNGKTFTLPNGTECKIVFDA